MKKVLDRLMARQNKLMVQLSEPVPQQPAKPVVLDAATLTALREREQQAVNTATQHLSQGDIESADALLSPHADSARFVRTLTLLSRIRAIQGNYDEARELLLQAEGIDPADPKVAHFMAELLQLRGQHQEAIQYRRRLAYSSKDSSPTLLANLIVTISKATARAPRPPIAEVRAAASRLKSLPDADPAVLTEAAQALFSFPTLRGEALSVLTAASPCPEGYKDVEAEWLTLLRWCKRSGAALHAISEGGVPGRRPQLAELRDAVIHPKFQWLPTLDNHRVLISGIAASRIKLKSEDGDSPLLLTDDRRAFVRVPQHVGRVTGPALLVGGSGAYYHDVIEYVGALAVAESLGSVDDLRIIVPERMAPHQRELLNLLGYGDDRLLAVPDDLPILFEQIAFPSRLGAGGDWFDPLLPDWYRRRLAANRGGLGARKLYLTRAGTARRRLLNEEDVAAAFAKHGYECIAPERLTVNEQITLFAGATHIAGAAGAAMTNMLFAPPGARLTMLYSRHVAQGRGDLYFKALAQACGHAAKIVECTPVQAVTGQRSIDSDLRVDLRRLNEALESEE